MSLQEDIQAWDAEARKALAYVRSKPWGREAYLSSDMSYIHIPAGKTGGSSAICAEMASVRKFRPNA